MKLTDQEVFDKVYLGLAAQGFEQSLINHSCAYRGENNRKCAAGMILPDEMYFPQMEGKSVSRILAFDDLVLNLSLLIMLQDAHDRSEGPTEMRERLHSVAIQCNLSIPPLPNGDDSNG